MGLLLSDSSSNGKPEHKRGDGVGTPRLWGRGSPRGGVQTRPRPRLARQGRGTWCQCLPLAELSQEARGYRDQARWVIDVSLLVHRAG